MASTFVIQKTKQAVMSPSIRPSKECSMERLLHPNLSNAVDSLKNVLTIDIRVRSAQHEAILGRSGRMRRRPGLICTMSNLTAFEYSKQQRGPNSCNGEFLTKMLPSCIRYPTSNCSKPKSLDQ
jgi:hypothetical protein